MRTIPLAMQNRWEAGGPYVGVDGAPHTRVTVEPGWTLNPTSAITTADPTKLPFRWFQRLDNSQIEVEVPNLKSVNIDRSLSTDAASCQIVLNNQWMIDNGDDTFAGQLGIPGYFTANHGDTAANTLWDQQPNSWSGVLVQNALLRTYQGYGQLDSTIPEAVAAGNLLLTGLWMIDDVQAGTDGLLHITARDMAKLLITQPIVPPLIPNGWYPIHYYRYWYSNVLNPAVPFYDETDPVESGPGNEGPKYITDITMSADGAGYWMVGTDGGVFSFGCFGGETRFMTWNGPRTFAETAGTVQRVLTSHGSWVDAPIRQFGQQPLWDVVVRRNKVRRTIRATPTHEWFVRTRTDSTRGERRSTTTAALRPGDRLAWTFPRPGVRMGDSQPSPFGIAHGIVFGDGSIQDGNDNAHVVLYGDKADDLARWFPLNPTAEQAARNPEVQELRVTSLPGMWKDCPSADAGDLYLLGWLAGYFATDGYVSEQGQVILGSRDRSAIEMVQLIGDRLGIGTYTMYESTRDDRPFYSVELRSSDLTERFFLRPRHLARWAASTDRRCERLGWTVESVTPTDTIEPVYCATVDGIGNFALEDNLLVGNSPFHGSRGSDTDPGPMAAIAADPLNHGYWIALADGAVYTFGEVGYHGRAQTTSPIVGMAAHPSGAGYFLVNEAGYVFKCGEAGVHNSVEPIVEFMNPAAAVADIVAHPGGGGFWVVDQQGHVYTGGNAGYFGNGATGADPVVGMACTPDGGGYWLCRGSGQVQVFGNAKLFDMNGTWGPDLDPPVPLNDPIQSMAATPSGNGYVLAGGDGGVFTFGDAPFYGSLVADWRSQTQHDGNLDDFSDVVSDLLRWAGFLAYGDGQDNVYGLVETTGTYPLGNLSPDLFDKKPVIDPITQIKEAVGFCLYIGEEGEAHFQSPNWFSIGNNLDTGGRTSTLIVLEDQHQITDYKATFAGSDVRSEITISSDDPTYGFADTVTTRLDLTFDPLVGPLRRGMLLPAMLVNHFISKKVEQERMAQRIRDQIVFSFRQGTITCPFNPAIQLNDQIRIRERNTADSYVHYVRGIQTAHDLDTGQFLMTLTTNWLGDL